MSALGPFHGGGDLSERLRLAKSNDLLTAENRLLRAFVAACDLDTANTTDATRRAVRKLRASIGAVDADAIAAARVIIESFK